MMDGIIFYVIAIFFVINGLYDRKCKKPVGIYANMKAPDEFQIKDVRAYNRAVGNLILCYAGVLFLNGIVAMIFDHIVMSVFVLATVFPGAIAMMILYELVIVRRYFWRY